MKITRLIGCRSSAWYFPTSAAVARRASQRGRNRNGSIRANSIRSAGSSVIASVAASAIAKFLEYASGLNSRPSWSTNAKIGRNATAITSSEKNTEGPTSWSASSRTRRKSPFPPEACQAWILL